MPPPGTEIPEKGIEYSRRTYNLPWNLPPDEVDYGFDNIGDVLTLPPHLLESYFEVGGLVIDRVMADTVPDRATNETTRRPKALAIRPGPSKSEELAARENLALLAQRAFRRPVAAAEVQKLVDLFLLGSPAGTDIRRRHEDSLAGPAWFRPIFCSEPNAPSLLPKTCGRSMITNWRVACRISSGAACPMRSCSAWRANESSPTPQCSSSRFAGCSSIRKRNLWPSTSRRSGCRSTTFRR